MGMAENCHARTPAKMRSRLAIVDRSITQIAYRGKPQLPRCDSPITSTPGLDIFPSVRSTSH